MLRAGWGRAGAHGGGRRPGIIRCQDKGPPRAWLFTVHSLPQPQTPGLPTRPRPARVGPGIVTGLPHSATELFILTRAAGGGHGLQSPLQGSPWPRGPAHFWECPPGSPRVCLSRPE